MSAYITLSLIQGQGAIIDAGSIIGVFHHGSNPDVMGTPEKPLHLILRGGETVPGVIGATAREIMATVEQAKLDAKAQAKTSRYG